MLEKAQMVEEDDEFTTESDERWNAQSLNATTGGDGGLTNTRNSQRDVEELTGEASEVMWKRSEELSGGVRQTRKEETTHAGDV